MRTEQDQTPKPIAPRLAKFAIGQIVKHRFYPFRGVIYDVDPIFSNTDEWYNAIPAAMRPRKDQPFYHLYAENEKGAYEAYVSEQNLLADGDGGPIKHPMIAEIFRDEVIEGRYRPRPNTIQRLFN